MNTCLDLAILGLNKTKTNPLVGCVIVYNKEIVSSGYHEKYGGPHAESNAINNLKKSNPSNYKTILKNSTIYINLEPCSHYGKTPPCTELIIKYKIKQVVIGTLDPFKKVNGSGIQKLQKYSKVLVGVNQEKCLKVNKKYFINQKLSRPYIVLKWAESKDGFISDSSKEITKISGEKSIKLSHEWRSEIDAIMVGTNTVLFDNPQLTNRMSIGNNPIRVTIDRKNKLNHKKWNIMNGDAETIILNEKKSIKKDNIYYLDYRQSGNETLNSDQKKMANIMEVLYQNSITSILIEGGSIILNNLITQGLWDEARIFVSKNKLYQGVRAPEIEYKEKSHMVRESGEDLLYLMENKNELII